MSSDAPAGRLDIGLPRGTRVELDPTTRRVGSEVLFGGSPARALRLSVAGLRALDELRAGPVASTASAKLARRLTDAGLANPVPVPTGRLDVTVVIPVKDRVGELERCLEAVGTDHPVLVVDDGSDDPAAVAMTCAAHGAELARRSLSGGPGVARNFGVGLTNLGFVAFVDSDCAPGPDWIAMLAGHFADPLVAAVAPRIVALGPFGRTAASRYGSARSPLDLGDRACLVKPGARVSYVPTAALIVRRAAFGEGFDEQLRYGEDVDLVWRLAAGGWRVRFDPRVRVAHREPASWPALVRRRYHYGTSVVALTRRHPGATVPLVLRPWPTLTVLALAARRPAYAALAYAGGTVLLARRARSSGLPVRGIVGLMPRSVWQTFLATSRWASQFASPVLIALVVRPGGSKRTRRGRRAVITAMLVGFSLSEWATRRPKLDPVRFAMGVLADEAAYGAGVWRQCLRDKMWSPALPRFAAIHAPDLQAPDRTAPAVDGAY